MLMLTELPEMVTMFERFFSLNTVKVTGYTAFEKLLALNYNSFILTMGIIGVDSHARDMNGNSHSQGT